MWAQAQGCVGARARTWVCVSVMLYIKRVDGMDGNVEKQLATIKGQMPDTYAEIQRAAKAAGKGVYAVVRAGLRGEPNAFWACERGHVVGTPFEMRPAVAGEIASYIMRYGMTNLVFWSPAIARGLHVEAPA